MALKVSQNHKGMLSLFGTCFFFIVLGSMYIWGNISIYVSSYYKGVSSDQGSMVFPIASTFSNFCCLFSFPIIKMIGFRKLLISTSFMLFAFLLGSTFCPDFWSFFICFGIGFCGCSGFLYLTLLYNTYKYFPSKRGLIGGIAVGFYGTAALISNYILLALINPDNADAHKDPQTGEYVFPDEIAERLPGALRLLSYVFLGVMIIGNVTQFEYVDPINEVSEDDKIKEEIIVVEEENTQLKTRLLPEEPKKGSINNDDEEVKGKKIIGRSLLSQKETVNPNSYIDSSGYANPIKIVHSVTESMGTEIKKKSIEWSKSSIDINDERRCFP